MGKFWYHHVEKKKPFNIIVNNVIARILVIQYLLYMCLDVILYVVINVIMDKIWALYWRGF